MWNRGSDIIKMRMVTMNVKGRGSVRLSQVSLVLQILQSDYIIYLHDCFGDIRAEMSDEEPAERAAFNPYFRFLFFIYCIYEPTP